MSVISKESKRLRNAAIIELRAILEPFQIAMLDTWDVVYDEGKMFLRIQLRGHNVQELDFIHLGKRIQTAIETFLESGRIDYTAEPGPLFPNRFGKKMSTRSISNIISTEGIIYFIGDEHGRVKIGYTTGHAGQRLTGIQCHNADELTLLATEKGSQKREKELHRRFALSYIRGEWYWLHSDILAYIRTLNDAKTQKAEYNAQQQHDDQQIISQLLDEDEVYAQIAKQAYEMGLGSPRMAQEYLTK